VSDVVRAYYNQHVEDEWKRLDRPICRIEFASTLRLIERHLPAKSKVCDIGGGPGRYAIELLKRGHDVTLIDLSEEEVAFARRKINKCGLKAAAMFVGDARNLSMLDSATFDASLMLGPLIHIIDPIERTAALSELRRVLKAKGVAIISYLNSWGLIRTGINDFPKRYADISFLRSLLGELVWKGKELSGFTECYWSTPPDALAEVQKAGFEVVTYAGAEGFANRMAPQLQKLMSEIPEAYDNVVKVAAETSELPQYRDACDHLHIVVRKR